ncbi:MAG TPA: polysaccharide deacetylase family protein [Myxococcaceae bacterium]|nr:polysaccharide deacetylase family protein [Myxococcaceae bacterium]
MGGLASISIDLDGLGHYPALHGLPAGVVSAEARGLVHRVAVPRFAELVEGVGGRGTLFVIGSEVDQAARAPLEDALRRGHELGSHTHRHDYALSRRPPEEIDRDLGRAEEVLASLGALPPLGFRAPGYTLSPALLRAVVARGYAYDASIFPAAPYWAAKALTLGWLRLRGRRSAAILDSPRVLLAPRLPYRPDPDRPERRGAAPLLELPMSVTPGARLPFIGTLVVLAPWPMVRAAYARLRGEPFLSLELHAVDVLGPEDGLPPELARAQPDLALPLSTKLSRLRQVLEWAARDFQLLPLREAARSLEAAATSPVPAGSRRG